MSGERKGPGQPQPSSPLPDAAPEALRALYEQILTLGDRPEVQTIFMHLASDPYTSSLPVPGREGVELTQTFVQWLNGFERHARNQLDAWAIVDGAVEYLRREREGGNPDQGDSS